MTIKEFLELFKQNPTISCLKLCSKKLRGCDFSKGLNLILDENPKLEENLKCLLKNSKEQSRKYISAFLQSKLRPCPVCKKLILNTLKTCSKKCQGLNPATKLKRKQTNIKNFGFENPFQAEEFKTKSRQTLKEKFGVEFSSQTQNWKEKVKETCLKKFGTEFASQSFLGKQSHIQHPEQLCSKEFVTKNFIFKNRFLIHDFCNYFNLSLSAGFDYKTRYNINIPNKLEIGKAQSNLFDWIPTKNKILNDRVIIKPKELDIVLPGIKLGIEYDGVFWHSKLNPNYHFQKTQQCEKLGYQLFHIFETDNIEIWKSIIQNKLGLSKKIYARKCKIKELDNLEYKTFLEENHLQGFCTAKIKLGLYYKNKLVEIMSFGKPRFNSHYEYELLRLCSLKGVLVVGGATKLFKYFLKKFKPCSVISYANRRFSQGKIYEILGFKFLKFTRPGYFYFKNGKIFSRNKFQKHKLNKLLKDFDPKLSESENMFKNGFKKIYDCGNLVYEFKI